MQILLAQPLMQGSQNSTLHNLQSERQSTRHSQALPGEVDFDVQLQTNSSLGDSLRVRLEKRGRLPGNDRRAGLGIPGNFRDSEYLYSLKLTSVNKPAHLKRRRAVACSNMVVSIELHYLFQRQKPIPLPTD